MFHLFLPPQTPTEAVTYLEHRFWLTAASGGSGLEIKNEFWNTRDNSPATAVDLAAFALHRPEYRAEQRGPQIYLELREECPAEKRPRKISFYCPG